MIVLAVQLQIFVLSIMSGWLYGLCYSFLQQLHSKKKYSCFLLLVDVVFQIAFHSSVYYILFSLNGGMLRIYYVLLFLLGLFLYYLWYYPIVLPVYCGIIYYVKLPIKWIYLVFSQFISIINMLLNSMKRRVRLRHDECTKKKSG